jgi:hypothetical protein
MGNRAQEVTQRTRSFLFLSLAAATAFQLGIQKISICENGVASLNIPISGQTVGTLLTRSTHPAFLKQFQDFTRQIVEAETSVTNPFLFKTKTEMIKMLRTWSQADLMGGTISCSYTQGRTRLQPQCGTCFQCVNRRFSVIAAGEEAHDPVEYYEKDLFTHPLEEGRETAYAEGYVRTAYEIAQLNDGQLFAKYPQLQDVERPEDLSADQCGQELYDLFQRHAEEVIGVAEAKLTQHRRDLLVSRPSNSSTKSLDLGQDGIRRRGPGEGRRGDVIFFDKAFDPAHELLHTAKRAAADRALRDDIEPDLHLVEPGGIGGGVVNVIARSRR